MHGKKQTIQMDEGQPIKMDASFLISYANICYLHQAAMAHPDPMEIQMPKKTQTFKYNIPYRFIYIFNWLVVVVVAIFDYYLQTSVLHSNPHKIVRNGNCVRIYRSSLGSASGHVAFHKRKTIILQFLSNQTEILQQQKNTHNLRGKYKENIPGNDVRSSFFKDLN